VEEVNVLGVECGCFYVVQSSLCSIQTSRGSDRDSAVSNRFWQSQSFGLVLTKLRPYPVVRRLLSTVRRLPADSLECFCVENFAIAQLNHQVIVIVIR